MKLNELTITQQMKQAAQDAMRTAPPEALKRMLTAHGWRSLGIGVEGAVAEHPKKSYVLKIFTEDSAYRHFVEFVQQNQSNPHLPKFSRYVRQIPGLPFMYVRMEKLKSISENLLLKKYMNHLLMLNLMGQMHEMETLPGDLHDTVQEWCGNHGFDLVDLTDSDVQSHIFEAAGGYPPDSWSHVLDLLALNSLGHEIDVWDLHAGNFMLRGKTLVIADPYF